MRGSWLAEFLDELETFPRSRHDDQEPMGPMIDINEGLPKPNYFADVVIIGVVSDRAST